MTVASVPHITFAGGELSPSLYARFDLPKYQTAAALIKNFIVHPEGGASNRPGIKFIAPCKYADKECRLIKFQYNVEQGYALEFGDQYMRVFSEGQQVVYPSGHPQVGQPVEITTDYLEADLDLIKFTQTADLLYLAHPSYPMKKVSRISSTQWSYQTVSIGSTTTPPVTAAMTGGSGTVATYCVTATVAGEESLISNEQSGNDQGATLPWAAVFGVDEYTVYKKENGIFYYLATVSGSSSSYTTDSTVGVDHDSTPPDAYDPFSNSPVLSGLSTDIVPVQSYVGGNSCSGGGWTVVMTGSGGFGNLHSMFDDVGATVVQRGPGWSTITFTFTPPSATQVSGFSYKASTIGVPLRSPTYFKMVGITGGTPTTLFDQSGLSWGSQETKTFSFENQIAYTSYVLTVTNGNWDVNELKQIELFTGTYSASVNNPGAIAFHQQRLVPARTDTQPQTFFGSQTNRFANFNVSTPLRATDSYEFTISDQQMNEIKWMVSYRNDLMIGTSGSEWIATGSDSSGITPTSINVKLESRYGSGDQPAIIIGNSILFVERGGRIIRDFSYNLSDDGFRGGDLTLLGSHLFRERQIKEWAFQRLPYSILWCVMNDGVLLGLTYDKGQDVWGWHQHETDGTFESLSDVRSI